MVKKKQFNNFLFTLILVVVLDQLTKILIKTGIIKINFIQNTGSLFGMMPGSSTYIIWFSLVVIGIFFYNYENILKSNKILKIGSGLIVGGALGNLIDRIAYGGVIDFIDIGWWPSFNIADSALCTGIGLLFIYFLFEDKFKKKK